MSTAAGHKNNETLKSGAKSNSRMPFFVAAISVIAVVLWLANVFYQRTMYVKSSNAAVSGDFTTLASQIPSQVSLVLVQENQHVKMNQILCVLDDRLLQAAHLAAKESRAAIGANLELADRELRRTQRLFRVGSATKEELDRARAGFRDLSKQFGSAQDSEHETALQLSYSVVRAPADGVIAFRTAQSGLHVQPGQPLFGFVSDRSRWIEAKIRETDIEDIRVGQEVDIHVEGLHRPDIRGRVISTPHASETPFAAIPPDFAAGNFTKYVQWVPVRIAMETREEDQTEIPIGLSSEIRMRRMAAK